MHTTSASVLHGSLCVPVANACTHCTYMTRTAWEPFDLPRALQQLHTLHQLHVTVVHSFAVFDSPWLLECAESAPCISESVTKRCPVCYCSQVCTNPQARELELLVSFLLYYITFCVSSFKVQVYCLPLQYRINAYDKCFGTAWSSLCTCSK